MCVACGEALWRYDVGRRLLVFGVKCGLGVIPDMALCDIPEVGTSVLESSLAIGWSITKAISHRALKWGLLDFYFGASVIISRWNGIILNKAQRIRQRLVPFEEVDALCTLVGMGLEL